MRAFHREHTVPQSSGQAPNGACPTGSSTWGPCPALGLNPTALEGGAPGYPHSHLLTGQGVTRTGRDPCTGERPTVTLGR